MKPIVLIYEKHISVSFPELFRDGDQDVNGYSAQIYELPQENTGTLTYIKSVKVKYLDNIRNFL